MTGPAKRKPTAGERVCIVCKGPGCYAAGFHDQAPQWCREHVPPGFLPAGRKEPGQ